MNKIMTKNTTDISAAFAEAAATELAARREKRQDNEREAKKAASEKSAKARAENAARKREQAFAKKTLETLLKPIEAQFAAFSGQGERFSVGIDGATNVLSLELRQRGSSARDDQFSLKAYAKGGKLYFRASGFDIDPQLRGVERETTPERLLKNVTYYATKYGSDADLKKLKATANRLKRAKTPKP